MSVATPQTVDRVPLTWSAAVLFTLLAAGVIWAAPTAGWAALLTAGILGLHITLGVGLFSAISVVSGARWWDGLQPVVRALGVCILVPAALLAITFAFGLDTLYEWADPEVVSTHHLIHEKVAWLNEPFFLGRATLLLVLFVGATRALVKNTQPPAVGLAAAYIVFVGAGSCVAAWDWLMSLEAEWFSTMYGIYAFASSILAGLAALALVAHLLDRAPWSGVHFTGAQRHDLGKLIHGFSLFWAYIWFCQYMLIWYANLPEETSHYTVRMHDGWASLFWLNPVVSFVLPFVLLLSERAKRHPATLAQVAGLILLGRWLDIHLLIAPSVGLHADLPWLSAPAVALFLVVSLIVGRRELTAGK